MNPDERKIIRRGVIAHCIEGGDDFGACTAKLLPLLPGRTFPEVLKVVDRTWRQERRPGA